MSDSIRHPSANLDPSMRIARAEINVVERGVTPSGYVRADPGLHHALTAYPRQPWIAPQAPRPASEQEMRQELEAALEARSAAEQVLSRASQAFSRAEHHRQKAEARLATFYGLDDRLTAHALDMARCTQGIDEVLPEALAQRITERAAAEVTHRACCDASTLLRREMAEASKAMGDASTHVDTLAVQVLGIVAADRMAAECAAFAAEIERRRTALGGFDRVATSAKVPLSHEVMRVMNGQYVPRPDLQPWQAALDALKADPEAKVEIELPPATIAEPPPISFGSTVVDAVASGVSVPVLDDGDPHQLVESEPSP
jgi:hypothetical protein